jgi:uncharacterized protein (DUF58 family)
MQINKTELLLSKYEEGSIPLTLKNRFAIPAMPVRISGSFQTFGQTENTLNISETYIPVTPNVIFAPLQPFSKQEINLKISFPYCGEYEVTIDTIEFYDLLKLFRVRRKVNKVIKAVVLPREITIPIFENNSENETENTAIPLSSDEANYSSLREYREGDTLRRVHWKLSAQREAVSASEPLIVRQSEQTRDNSCVIFCDFIPQNADYNYVIPRIRDAVIEIALSITRQVVLSGNTVTIVWQGTSIIVQDYENYREFYSILARMSRSEPFGDFSAFLINSAEYFTNNSSVYIIEPFITYTILDTLNLFGAASDCGVTLVFPSNVSEKIINFIKTETKMSYIKCDEMF